MSGKFQPISVKQLLQIILKEYGRDKSIFGIPEELFFVPEQNQKIRTELFNQRLDSPLGVAAGPHSQMAQNIVGAWLMGARYIELKTVQTLDEIEVSKPCIDMHDEGYNCEWSQELKIEESFNEYLNGWILIHILNHKFGRGRDTGTIFNMSVGYNMKGILNENVQWFLEKMTGCQVELAEKVSEILSVYPQADQVYIPSKISDNITLSTMHGCPAYEIEEIAGYLLEKCNLHTFIKLNPTLLGPDQLRQILNNKLNFKTIIPDIAFEHDLKYTDAIKIIKTLKEKAKAKNLHFGLKLTNTLESVNNKGLFGSSTEMIYMSGRALHPISINIARRLSQEFNGELLLSFSSGTDAFNLPDVISCGFITVTVCTDILKPGGFMRLKQYFDELNKRITAGNSKNINEFILKSSGKNNLKEAALANLNIYAKKVPDSPYYKREYLRTPDSKTTRELGYFDCISAPCIDTCPTNQDIPDYMYLTSNNKPDNAFGVILRTNPFPATTGMVCDHLCQNKCTRINYDEPLHIREVKRYVSELKEPEITPSAPNKLKVAIIGAGPAGLSCAYYLAMAGFHTEVFETRSKAGGMVRFAIPGFRLTDEAVEKDLKRVTDTGVGIHYNSKIDKDRFLSLGKDFDYIFIGTGAQLSSPLKIDGADAIGVIEPLNFLYNVKLGKANGIGKNVVIIGGGNTAMDAARTAYRLVGEDGSVTILYRRTINEMPADQGEKKAVLEEGIKIIELASPEKILQKDGKVNALICSRMELKGVDSKGRPNPFKIKDSEFRLLCDTVIPAIGQNSDLDFASGDLLTADSKTYKTTLKRVFIGGDALRGASTAINAISDGRKAAEQIIRESGIDFIFRKESIHKGLSKKELMIKRSGRIFAAKLRELPADDRKNFRLVSETLDKQTVIEEAERCLYCDEICNICTTVCPNFANYSYETDPIKYNLQKAVMLDNGTIDIQSDRVFEVFQKYQIINIVNFCNECGNCSTFCPTSGAPYKNKPKFFLTISAFNEAEEGYYLAKVNNRNNLIFKHMKSIETLSERADGYLFETDYVLASFSGSDFKLTDVKFKTPCVKQIHFEHAAEMSILIKAAKNLVFS